MSQEADAMALMKALIGKMESMDAELGMLRKQVSNPQSMLRKSGFVKAVTPANQTRSDAMGTPMPDTNQDWHDLSWDDIHSMANVAAESEGRRVDQ